MHFFAELLDELLVLVQLLGPGVHVVDDALRLLAVLGVAEHAELELGARIVGGDRAVETLVLLGIILLETSLQLDRLDELGGLSLAP